MGQVSQRQLLIYVDIDEVIYPWVQVSCEMLTEYCGKYIEPPQQYVQAADEWGLDPSAWQWLWTSAVDKGLYTRGLPMPGSVESLLRLAVSHRVELITQRPAETRMHTHKWLMDNGLQSFRLHFLPGSAARPSARKSTVEPHADVYIDDSPIVLQDILDHTDGIFILMNRPHNQGVPPGLRRIGRAHNWEQVAKYVKAEAEEEQAISS